MRQPLASLFSFFVLFGSGAVGADWTVVRDGQFEIYSQAGATQAKAALTWFEQLRALVRQETGLDVSKSNPVRVVAFTSEREYEPYRMTAMADAYYVGKTDRDYIVLPSLNRGSFPTAAHEYAHLVQHAAGAQLPPWLREGLADLLSTVRIDPEGARIGGDVASRMAVLRHRAWIPLDQLVALPVSSPLRENRAGSQLFYSQAWALTEMLALSPPYRSQFEKLVAALDRGVDSTVALTATYGKPLDRIKHDLGKWVDHPPKPLSLRNPTINDQPIGVQEIPAESVQLMLAGLLLDAGELNKAESIYRGMARPASGSAEASAGLAALAASRLEYDEARRLWGQALGQGLKDPEICFRFFELLDRGGGLLEERLSALQQAVALKPDFNDALWNLALLENNSGDYQSALDHLQSIRVVPLPRLYAHWNAMTDTLTALGRSKEAEAAAERASRYATTAEERSRSARLAYAARSHLAVQFSHDRSGNAQMVTTRVLNDDNEFNPFVEPSDDLRRVAGILREIECGSPEMRITLDIEGSSLQLLIPDASRVKMGNAPPEFACGRQPAKEVIVEYAATKTTGIVRGLTFK
jgi:tetratricopeptide (TPR) repeat protein